MATNKLIISLTADQQRRIKDATGRSVSELPIAFTDAELSDEELDKISGGDTVRKAGSGTTSGGGVYLIYTFGTVYTTATR